VVNLDEGGTAISTFISKGGVAYTHADATAIGIHVGSGGVEVVLSGAIVSETNVQSGGYLVVTPGGTTKGTIVATGGHVVSTGIIVIQPLTGATAYASVISNTALTSGAGADVLSGGSAIGAVISGDDSYLAIYGRGKVAGATVRATGELVVESGGIASGTIVSSGGDIYVSSAGTANGTVISSGGYAYLESAGTANGTVVSSGGTFEVLSGGIVAGGVTLAGGTAYIDSATVGAGQTVTFAGGNGDLVLQQPTAFSAAIGGFAAGDTIDLGTFAYATTETATFVEAASKTSGTLTIFDGAQTEKLTFLGTYATSNFALATDGSQGTLITDPPVKLTAAQVGQLVQGTASTPTALEITTGGAAKLNAGDTHLIVTLDAATNLNLGSATFIAVAGTASSFAGDVLADFGATNTIDITDIAFATFKSLGYTALTSGGTLKVSDLTHSATIALTGSYLLKNFITASDGHGGTLVSYMSG
jgi:autotransporter passenger strand-loop-strand repeat protein